MATGSNPQLSISLLWTLSCYHVIQQHSSVRGFFRVAGRLTAAADPSYLQHHHPQMMPTLQSRSIYALSPSKYDLEPQMLQKKKLLIFYKYLFQKMCCHFFIYIGNIM